MALRCFTAGKDASLKSAIMERAKRRILPYEFWSSGPYYLRKVVDRSDIPQLCAVARSITSGDDDVTSGGFYRQDIEGIIMMIQIGEWERDRVKR